MRDWQKTARKPPRPSGGSLPIWVIWAVLALIAGTVTWYQGRAAGETAVQASTFSCTVASITDGDTFRCADGTRVRLSAIAARERDGTCSLGHPCPAASAQSATDALSRLALGRTLTCKANGQSYDRITAWCDDETGTQLNCAMIEGGYAARWDKFDPTRRLCR